MSSTTTIETLSVPGGGGGGGGNFPGYRNAAISNASTPLPQQVCMFLSNNYCHVNNKYFIVSG